MHEDEAATRLAKAVAGPGLHWTEPAEGKPELKAAIGGLLKIDVEAMEEINGIDQIVLASLHSNQRITEGTTVAGSRVVPLVIESTRYSGWRTICRTSVRRLSKSNRSRA